MLDTPKFDGLLVLGMLVVWIAATLEFGVYMANSFFG